MDHRPLAARCQPVTGAVGQVVPHAPSALTRRDGEFILTSHGSALHTSHGVIAAEQSLLDASRTPTAYIAPQRRLDRVITSSAKKDGRSLNAGQRALAEHFIGSGALVAAGVGPAGTGKTTAMKAVSDTWQDYGHEVLALAPSAVAAEVLGDEIGVQGLTLATLTYPWRGLHEHMGIPARTIPDRVTIAPGTMLLVDEASLASTKDLAAITEIAQHHGAIVRLLGDPGQLDAVETGGAFRMLAEESRAPELTDVVRFGDDLQQAENSLALRKGENESLDLYFDRGWVQAGTATEMREAAVRGYLADTDAGLSSMVMLSTVDDVREVNLAVQARHRATGIATEAGAIPLSDELHAGVGDTVLTRRNNRELRAVGGRRRNTFVRNGDLWTVTAVNPDGSLVVRSKAHTGTITLPATYVRENTELGYAATVHRSQGITVDTSHTCPTGNMNRAGLYVALTRGRSDNRLYVSTEPGVTLDTEGMHLSELDTPTERLVLNQILAADNGHKAALTELKEATAHARSPERLREAYLAAHTRLHEHWLDTTLDRALPAAVLATIDAGDPKSRQALRDALAQINNSGNSATHVLTAAVNDGELHTSRNIAAVLRSRIETHSPIPLGNTTDGESVALPALPPRVAGTDKELDDYARTVAAKYAQARPDHTPQPGIGESIRAYEATQKRVDEQRVNVPLAAVFDDTTAERLAHERGVHRLGRQLGKATLAGLDPNAVLGWHAQQLRGRDQDITVMGLIRDMGPAIEQATLAANTAWLRDHDAVLREHFPIATALVDRTDDPRWNTAAGRMRELTDTGHYALPELCEKVKATTRSSATAAGILDALDTIAPAGQHPTNPNAPRWVPSPALDADHVDTTLAGELRDQYTHISAEHADHTRALGHDEATDMVPASFTAEVGPRPDDPQLRQEWARTAAEVHAYRHTYEITDTTSVAGDRPHEHTERVAFNNVHTSIETYREHLEQHHENQHHQQQHELERHHTIATQQQSIDQERRGPRM
ncbi:ATP-dependent RecD-like DNA helicase [Rhodococcus sp. NPDC058521]|uniref:ATP-dependent DNA helicase n=1 Tax=Rhodococcus sp. NPDC058521 TaxID=3346536 RepID=UPI00364F3935